MKPYLVSLLVGILVGGIYALLRVRSPAPPVVALAGLLGILIGEQVVGMARAQLWPEPPSAPIAAEPASSLPGNRHAP